MNLFNQQQDTPMQQMPSNGAQFDYLQESGLGTELSSKLKSTLVGGYNKKSVEDFVAEMRGNLQQIKSQLEQQIHDITAEKATVSRECVVLREQLRVAEENSAKLQSQIVEQTLLEERCQESEKELESSRNEIQQLQNMLEQYGDLQDEREQLKRNIEEKEQRIANLNEELAKYKERCRTLEQNGAELEAQLCSARSGHGSAVDYEELERYRVLLQQAEAKSAVLEQQLSAATASRTELEAAGSIHPEEMEKLMQRETQLAEKEQVLQEKEAQLQEKEAQFQQEAAQLAAEKSSMEKNRADMQELYHQLQDDLDKNRHLSMQLDEKDAALSQKMLQMQSELATKEQELSAVKEKMGLRNGSLQDVSEKIDQLFQNYTKHTERVKTLETQISEKDALVQHYQKYEQENILLRKECEKDKQVSLQLREALEKVVKEMENQAAGVQMYAARAAQDRESLQRTLSELTNLKLEHVELMDSMSRLTEAYETVRKEKLTAEKELQHLKEDRSTRIFDLSSVLTEKEPPAEEDVELAQCDGALQRAKLLLQQVKDKQNNPLEQNA